MCRAGLGILDGLQLPGLRQDSWQLLIDSRHGKHRHPSDATLVALLVTVDNGPSLSCRMRSVV